MAIDLSVGIPNEVQNKVALAGREVSRGVAVAPTTKWPGAFMLNKNRPLTRKERATGGYDRLVDVQRGLPEFPGTYAEELTFETLPQHAVLGVGDGGIGVGDSNAEEGFLHRIVTNFDRDDIHSATVVHGIDGLAYRSVGVMHDEFTITADITDTDNVWKWSSTLFAVDRQRLPGEVDGVATGGTTGGLTMTGAGWAPDDFIGWYCYIAFGTHVGPVREIVDNDETTLTFGGPALGTAVVAGTRFLISPNPPTIGDPDLETIPVLGSSLFIDRYNASSSTLGATDLSDRMISASLTVQNGRSAKTMWSGRSKKTGRASRVVSGIIVVEFDRWDEMAAWEEDDELSIRWENEGSVIDATAGTHKRARIDIERAVIDQPEEQSRDNNMTLSVAWVGLLPASDPVLAIETVNTLATLP